MKNYTVYIERDEDGMLVGSVPSLYGCYSQGATLDELLANMREVVTLCARNQETDSVGEFVGVQNVSIAV